MALNDLTWLQSSAKSYAIHPKNLQHIQFCNFRKQHRLFLSITEAAHASPDGRNPTQPTCIDDARAHLTDFAHARDGLAVDNIVLPTEHLL